jgi:hypothetical protein
VKPRGEWREVKDFFGTINCPGGVGELSSRFQPEKVRRDALLTSERRDILG